MALPTLTWVAPNCTAVSKSALMPMLRPVQAVALRDLLQKREVQGGLFVNRRYAHQSFDLERALVAAEGDKLVGLIRQNAGFLGFCSRIDLNEHWHLPANMLHFPREDTRKLFPVDRLDAIEQLNRIARLVGLKRPDQVKLQIGILVLEGGPFSLRFLDPVLAKHLWPASMTGRIATASNVFETATSWTDPCGRPAFSATAPIRSSTSPSRLRLAASFACVVISPKCSVMALLTSAN